MHTLKHLKTFNQIYKEMDIVYHKYAKCCGLSDMAYWILYSIAESDDAFTQRDFCKNWFFAPQTVNSALKDLEKKDIIFLEAVEGNKKNKLIKLTKNGEQFTKRFILPLIKTECESFETLSEEKCELMLSATRQYLSALKDKIHILEADLPKSEEAFNE